jgi:uncharacterized repeat protein (TIGR01451 family)
VPLPGAYESLTSSIVSIPNPDIPDSLLCQDLKVVFVLDESGSIQQSGATQAVRDGVRALANALFNSGATLQIVEFSTNSSIVDLGSNLVDITFLTRLESYLGTGYNGQNYNPIGATNWHDALVDVLGLTADLVVFFTDGYPTAYNGADGSPVVQGGSATFPPALDSAVFYANLIKSQGKHMFVVGVGPGIDLPNIQAIGDGDQFGGPVTVLTADYTTPPYEELANNLAAAVNTICGTELVISKSASSSGVCAGESVIFKTTITNTGGSFNFDANNVSITDHYPNGYSDIEVLYPLSGTDIIGGNTVVYPIGILGTGESDSLIVRAVVDAPPSEYNNVATGTAFNANPVKDSISILSGFATNSIEITSCSAVTLNGQTYSASGVYTQTLVSAAGCDSVLTINLILKTAATNPIRCSGSGISCIGSCNGIARVSVYGDPSTYDIVWNTTPPKTGTEIFGLCPGTYMVKTIDVDGCSDSCSITISNEPCTDFRTFTQGGYGATPKGKNVASYLKSKFAAVFPSGLSIGCQNRLNLTNWQAVVDFLPSGSTPRGLPLGLLINPGQTYQNVLAGQLTAATLNVKFDSAFSNFSPNNILLKDLIIASGTFQGWSVSRLLEEANKAIGGCGSSYSFSAFNLALDMINMNYNYNEYMNSPLNNKCYLSCPINSNHTLMARGGDYSNIETIVSESFGQLQVFPNPVKDELNIRYTAEKDGKVKIRILSGMGTIIKEIVDMRLTSGQVTESKIFVDMLTPGIFWIRVTDENEKLLELRKLIKR